MKLTIAALGLFALAVAAAGAEENSQEELAVAEARHHGYGGGHGGQRGGHRGGYGKGQNRGYGGHGHNRGKRDTEAVEVVEVPAGEEVEELSGAESRHIGYGGWGHVRIGHGHGGYGHGGHGHGSYLRGGHGHYRGKRDTEAVEVAAEDLVDAESRHRGYGGHGLALGGYGHGAIRGHGYGHGHGGHYRGKRDTEAVEVAAEDLEDAESRHRGYGGHGLARGGYGHGAIRGGYGHGHGGHYRGKRDTEAVEVVADEAAEDLVDAESRHQGYGGHGLARGGYGHGAIRGHGVYGHGHGGHYRGKRDVEAVEDMSTDESRHGYSHGLVLSHRYSHGGIRGGYGHGGWSHGGYSHGGYGRRHW